MNFFAMTITRLISTVILGIITYILYVNDTKEYGFWAAPAIITLIMTMFTIVISLFWAGSL